MKKNSFLFIIVFLSFYCFSQNYETIKPESLSYFGEHFYPIQIDSTTYSGDTIFYHNFKMIRHLDYETSLLNGSSWTGKNILVFPNGYNYFINKSSDTIKINTLALQDEPWEMFTFSDGTKIEARVTSIEDESFIGINDTVKTIHLQLQDNDGNNIVDEINDVYLKLSKNHGFTRIVNFFEFPNISYYDFLYPYSFEMDLTGFDEYGHQNLGAAEIFAYNINDERHIRDYFFEYECDDPYCKSLEKEIIKIINKTISGNTVTYTENRCGSFSIEDELQYTWDETINETIDLSDPEYAKFDNINFKPFHDIVNNKYYILNSNESQKWISSIFLVIDDNFLQLEFHQSEEGDWMEQNFDKMYYKSLGGPYHGCHMMCCVREKIPVYYKIGDTEWGYPYNCSDLLAVNDLEEDKLVVYPNPVKDIVNISTESGDIQKIDLFNSVGEKIMHINNPSTTININKLERGIYFLQVTNAEKQYYLKLIKN